IRFPIEQQVNGLEKVRYLRSRCTNDGRYALEVAFAPGVDPWRSQVLVQNRVALALPQLPAEVNAAGVNVPGGADGMALIITLGTLDRKHDALFLGSYADIHIKDELARVAGVGDVALLGAGDFNLRLWLDTDRLAALNLNVADVMRVLRQEKWDGADQQK